MGLVDQQLLLPFRPSHVNIILVQILSKWLKLHSKKKFFNCGTLSKATLDYLKTDCVSSGHLPSANWVENKKATLNSLKFPLFNKYDFYFTTKIQIFVSKTRPY